MQTHNFSVFNMSCVCVFYLGREARETDEPHVSLQEGSQIQPKHPMDAQKPTTEFLFRHTQNKNKTIQTTVKQTPAAEWNMSSLKNHS